MSGLSDIPVNVEAGTGNVIPLLHEIRHALQRVASGEQGTVIDLRSLPLAPGEEARIEEALGEGEIRAELNALGPSTIRETAFPGVWFVTHRNVENEVVARFIEVCRVPDLLKAPPEDMENAVRNLTRRLNDGGQEAM
jgi:hydrogenase-1 operon protein HyaF